MRLAVSCFFCFAPLLFWILSHLFLYTTNWNETSYLIGFDSVSGSVRLKAIGGANSGSYTEIESLAAPKEEGGEPSDAFGGPALVRSPLIGTITGNSDFLRSFEIDSSFDTFKSFTLLVTIPYWLLSLLGTVLAVIGRCNRTGTEQDEAGQSTTRAHLPRKMNFKINPVIEIALPGSGSPAL